MIILEIILDFVGLVISLIIIARSQDNQLKKLWGIFVAALMIIMIADNLKWAALKVLELDNQNSILVITRMIKWFFFANFMALFPIMSLRPGWLTPFKITIFSLPLIMTIVITACFFWFNGIITPIDNSIDDIIVNIYKPDVQLRILIFTISLATPMAYLLIPVFNRWIALRRKMSLGMYVYFGGGAVLLTSYVLCTLNISSIIFQIFGVIVVIVPISFSVLYLLGENPISIPRSQNEINQADSAQNQHADEVTPAIFKLAAKINHFVNENHPFTNPDYSLRQLAAELHTTQNLLMKTIQYIGFVGFHEYNNSLRIQYFKKIALESPGASVKELMFKSGFKSRSSFYRHFAEQENMSPKEYIDKHLNSKIKAK